MQLFKTKLSLFPVIACLLFATQARAIPVSLELALVLDISNSVDKDEYILQRDGYVNAFNNPGIQSAISALPQGVAVSLFFFSTTSTANRLDTGDPDYVMWSAPVVDWTLLQDGSDATAFASQISALARPVVDPDDPKGDTNIANAINTAAAELLGNGFEGRRVIDISGDGIQNTELDGSQPFNGCNGTNSIFNPQLCFDVIDPEVAAAEAADITINGVAITTESAQLAGYFQDHVITSDGFVVVAEDFNAFGDAILGKLGQELVIPIPAAIWLFGSGLAVLLACSRSKERKA